MDLVHHLDVNKNTTTTTTNTFLGDYCFCSDDGHHHKDQSQSTIHYLPHIASLLVPFIRH